MIYTLILSFAFSITSTLSIKMIIHIFYHRIEVSCYWLGEAKDSTENVVTKRSRNVEQSTVLISTCCQQWYESVTSGLATIQLLKYITGRLRTLHKFDIGLVERFEYERNGIHIHFSM